jgi:probable addiction module antidote protein
MIMKDYNETYAHKMRDKEYLDAYLKACLQESDEAFYIGLRRTVQARESGFTWLTAQTGLGRESLHRTLSAEGNPSFRTTRKVLRALGADESILAHMETTIKPKCRATNQRKIATS